MRTWVEELEVQTLQPTTVRLMEKVVKESLQCKRFCLYLSMAVLKMLEDETDAGDVT